jgi:hypothetical protein
MIRRPESFNRKSMHMLILAVALLAVIFAVQQQQAQAQAKTPAHEIGYEQGTSDAKDGMERNNTCPSDLDHGECFWYQQGYNLGYSNENFLHGNDRPRDNSDNNNDDN